MIPLSYHFAILVVISGFSFMNGTPPAIVPVLPLSHLRDVVLVKDWSSQVEALLMEYYLLYLFDYK